MRRILFLALAALTLCACARPAPPTLVLRDVPENALAARLARTAVDNRAALERAIGRSLDYVRARPAGERPFAQDGLHCTWADLGATLEHLRDILPRIGAEPGLLTRDFAWHEVRPRPLMTGYYEPELAASLVPAPGYPVPIHGLPTDLKTLDLGGFHPRWRGQTLTYRLQEGEIRPYFTRAQIDGQGALNGTAPIAWTRDEVDVYFLQVQGSGRLRLPDGSMRHVLYAGKNGHEYVSLGKTMIERGLIPREGVSMQRIRSWLAAHPGQVRELLHENPSYVFFRLAGDGPLGAMGRTLTPMVSMATDSAFLPLGSLLAVEADLPGPDGTRTRQTILGLAQDRGGAIKGSRLDLFCGAGAEAEFLAGHLQERARVLLLLKKEANCSELIP